MLYCKDCQRLVEGPVCRFCRNTKLRVPLDADFCMVAELNYPQAEMLKELYADNGVVCTERSVLGAGITVKLGINLERVRLYVPYEQFALAQELYDAFFNSDPIMEFEEPNAEADKAPEREVAIGQVYRHFKGGLYRVEGVAKHSETLEPYVVYRKLYDDESLWIRPKEMFLGPVDREKYPDAMQEFRFEPIAPDDAENPDGVE